MVRVRRPEHALHCGRVVAEPGHTRRKAGELRGRAMVRDVVKDAVRAVGQGRGYS